MTNKLEEYFRKGEKEYAVIGAFEITEDEFGRYNLTLNGLIEVLTLLQKAGLGDKQVSIGYDANICYTSIDSNNIIFRIKEDEILFNGDG